MSFEVGIYDAAERALSRVDGLKTLLVHAKSAIVEGRYSGAYSQEIRSACIVYSMAELESLVTTVIKLVNGEINKKRHDIRDVTPSLRSLAGHSYFESLKDIKDSTKVWEHRAVVTSFESCPDVLKLPIASRTAQPPLDGKTLTPRHFDLLWRVYGLDGNWFPRVSCAMTLSKLTQARNDLAHGNIPFSDVFSQPGYLIVDIEGYMEEMCELYIHFTESFFEHVTNSGYVNRP